MYFTVCLSIMVLSSSIKITDTFFMPPFVNASLTYPCSKMVRSCAFAPMHIKSRSNNSCCGLISIGILFLVFIIICEEVIFLRIDKIILSCRLFVKARITYSPFISLLVQLFGQIVIICFFLIFSTRKFINIIPKSYLFSLFLININY